MKKILSLLMLLVTIVSGAWADSYTLGFADETVNSCNGSYAEGIATFTCGSDVFTITNTGDKPKTNKNGDCTGSDKVKRYGVKYSQNVEFTVNIPTGVAIKSVTFSGWANHDSNSTKINKINDEDVSGSTGNSFGTKGAYDSWTYEFATAQTGSFTFVNKGAEGIFNITLTTESAPATQPTITTQPKDDSYVIGSNTYPSMSVVATASAGTLKYQWKFSNDGDNFQVIPANVVPSAAEATLLGSEAISVFQPTEPTTIYLRCSVTDGNGTVDSDVATLSIVNGEAPTISVAADKDATISLKGGSNVKLVATVTGSPEPTIQWYSKNGGITTLIEGATGAEYTPATTIYGTFEYLAKATNDAGEADSDPITVTVKPALQSVKFSNGVYGAIAEPATADVSGNIEVPYINYGETPEIDEKSLTAFNDTEAEISTDENVVTVISGAYSATYTYEFIPVDPIAVTADIASTNFTDVPSWVFNKYGYEAAKGLKFAKAEDGADNLRIAKGNTRQYYFVGPAKSMTLTAVEKVGDKSAIRKVNVYVNGAKVKSDTENNAIGAITLSPTSDNLVIIEAAEGTKGDGGFSAYSIVACDVKPTITVQPSSQVYKIGDTTYPSMSVEATGAGEMKYQWEFSTIGDAETFQSFPSSVPSAASATLSGEEVINALKNTDAGIEAGTYYARCRVTDDNGTAYSEVATLIISSTGLIITSEPNDITYTIGDSYPYVTVEATAATGTIAYDWKFSLNGNDFTSLTTMGISSASTNTLSGEEVFNALAPGGKIPAGTYYVKCTLTNEGSDTDTRVATITVEEAPAIDITTQPKNVTYTIGDTDYPSVSVEATASEGTITYDWKFSLNGNDFTSLTTMGITSASTNTLSGEEVFNVIAPGVEIPAGTYYLRCTLTNGDYSVETDIATITVNKPAELTPVSASTTWDFADVTWDGTTNKNDKGDYELVGDDRTTEYAYKDVSGLTFANTFNANAIAFKGQYPIRSNSKKHAQNGVVRIATSYPGTIKVSFTDTGTKATTDAVKRYLVVNGEQTEYWTSRENNGANPYSEQLNVTTGEINVAAGNITIEGTSAICVSKIVFTANATAINGIAEDTVDAENANVKIIKNGKLYIGKYNIAGQLVK